jgi:hypothetical protein
LSPLKVVYSIYNELAVVLGRAELLGITAQEETSIEAASVIKSAALNIRSLLRQIER